ncbi:MULTISPECIES: MAE_28990/MAE_18760 family HEPN-like nuclease [Micrococcaceae]|uniref:MAE_28990/MAE_18760 family HEPN-like nuclease n=1 Tax=Micrococcaceae TaxID=1268 RepID=UPI0013698F19|nr:MAE_28990/MAE_18760 family HEPN-like nuclease [Pseudarthrobacter sp. ATCC 49987]
MAKIRTLEALEDAISEETAWRKHELTTARKLVQQSSGSSQTANLRSGVLILYAHWEGWVKSVAQLYIRYVNSQSPTYAQLSAAFLGNALKVKISSIEEASTPAIHNEFASFLIEGFAGKARLSEDLVQTQSNLSSKVLSGVVERLGLPRRSEYSTRANMIDEELVNRRNTIAHGKFLELKADDFLTLHQDVLSLLQLFTDDVKNAASTNAHLAETV